jgi:hypothetical protein
VLAVLLHPLVFPGLAIPRKLSCPIKKKKIQILKAIRNDEITDFVNLNDQ